MIYVVVVTGYEGIDSLHWAGEDREEAIRRVRALRERFAKIATRREELEPDSDMLDGAEETWERFDEATLRMHKTLEAEFGKNGSYSMPPDHVCVQGYDADTSEFRCCCADLGVSPSKRMFR